MILKAFIADTRAETETRRYRFDPLYSGGPAFIDGFDVPAYIDLSTLSIDPAPKALLEHDLEQIVGYLDNIVNDGRTVSCDVIVGGTEAAAKVFDIEDNVAPFVPSIGVYRFTDNDIEWIGDGERAQVNGRDIIGAAAIVHNGALVEGSFVPIGGDGSARVARASVKLFRALKGAETMDEEKERERDKIEDMERDEARAAVDVEDIVDEAIDAKVDEIAEDVASDAVDAIVDEEETRAEIIEDVVDVAAEKLDAAEIVDELENIKDEIVDEIARDEVDDLEAVAKIAAKKAVAKIKRAKGKEARRVAALRIIAKKSPRLAAKAIERGWSVDDTQRRVKRAQARAGFPTIGRAGRVNEPKAQDVIAASLARTLGMSPERVQAAFHFDQRVIDAAESKEHRGATLKTVIAASNNSYRRGSFGVNTNLLDAWSDCRNNCRKATAAAGFSTINALDVFSLVLQAFLEPTAETAERVWQDVARVNTLADFNSVPSYLPTLQGRLREISETGAISNITFTTERYDRATKANGVNFTIPEMVIINDQIDVFAELLRQFETLGDDCIEHDVAETFWRVIDGDAKDAAGAALVSAARGNLVTGATLDESGIDAALTALASFSNANGAPLRVDRAKLLTPQKYASNALKIYHQEFVALNGGVATPNIWRGRFEPFVWAYLDAAHARATKADGTTPSLLASGCWAFIRDPQTRPVVCVNKLVGYEAPQIRTFDYDPSVWGLTYQMIYPYSVTTQYADGIVVVTE
ncbi:Mu-like prophage major head subunit gpT family protein [Candidatus Saccharibacteria bacterium]|nr:Mu-like prophage major head subunit gpT family protein [Candidatus Saccharibacteria bacterium]